MTRRREIMIRLLESLGLEVAAGETCEEMGERMIERAEELRELVRAREAEEDEREEEHDSQAQERRRQARESASLPQLVAASVGPQRASNGASSQAKPKRSRKRRSEGQAALGL